MRQEERDQAFTRGFALRFGSFELREQWRFADTPCRIRFLPFRVVEIVIGSPDRICSLEPCWALISNQHHSVKRLGAFQVKYVAIAIGQQHGPRKSIGIEPVGIAGCSGLSIDRADFE